MTTQYYNGKTPAALTLAAHRYLEAGLSLVPIDWATKQPHWKLLPQACVWPREKDDNGQPHTRIKGMWLTFTHQRPIAEEVDTWLAGGAQIALVGGPVSGGLLILDFDVARFYEAWRAAVGTLADGLPVQRTGGGGYQVLVRCTDEAFWTMADGRARGNEKLAWIPDDTKRDGRAIAIETRAARGYAVIAPSLHPSGNHYQMLESDPTATPVVSRAHIQALLDAAVLLDEAPLTRDQLEKANKATPKSDSYRAQLNGQGSVIDVFNKQVELLDELKRAGYVRQGSRFYLPGNGDRLRPGVVLLDEGRRSFHHDSEDPLSHGHSNTAFDVFCYFSHHGDCKAAVKAAAEQLGMQTEHTPQEPTFDGDGYACCPDCGTRLRQAKNGNGWRCLHDGKLAFWWQGEGYTPPAKTLDRAFILSCLYEDEAGDAQLLEALYRGQIVYDHSAGAWYEFVGHAWKAVMGSPRQRVWSKLAAVYLSLAAGLQAEMDHTEEDKKAALLVLVDTLTDRARKLRRLNRCNNVLTLAQELLGIVGDEWDRDPWVLAVPNGVIELRTGQLRDGRPEDYIRLTTPTEWKGIDCPAPRWERFVSEVMSDEQDRVAFLQRLFGYALNGTADEHVLALLVGQRGRNGKRVLMETVQAVIGEYATTVNTDVVVGNDDHRTAGSAQPHLMDLMGKRLAICSETKEGAQITAAQVKNITGGDRIRARKLHENPITFIPSHTLFLQTNHKPSAPADDDALWERVKVVEFKVRFVEEPTEPDERPRDPMLEPALRAEASGILAWLVRGHLAYRAGGLQTPPSVRLARDSYRRGESIDPFIASCCIEADFMQAEGGALYEAYKRWCQRGELRPKGPNWFGKQLAQRYEKGRPGAGRTTYYGIGLEAEGAAEGTTQNSIVPSAGSVMLQNTFDDRGSYTFSEGTTAFSKSMSKKATHEGILLEVPSVPSVPSAPPPNGVAYEVPAVTAPAAQPTATAPKVLGSLTVPANFDLGYARRMARGGTPQMLQGLRTHCTMRGVDYESVLAALQEVSNAAD